MICIKINSTPAQEKFLSAKEFAQANFTGYAAVNSIDGRIEFVTTLEFASIYLRMFHPNDVMMNRQLNLEFTHA